MKKIIIDLLVLFKIHLFFSFLNQKNKLSIIYYHDVDLASFTKHINYIKKKYNIIDLHTLINFLNDKKIKLPNYPILITFDDGHAGNYKLLNVFKQFNVRPIIFLTSNIIGTNKRFWFNIPFSDGDNKESLKKMKDSDRIQLINKKYLNHLTSEIPNALSIDQILEMNEYVDFQSHTCNHPCLPCTTDVVSNQEIAGSKKQIEEILGNEVISIAYPNGDFTKREIENCMKSGYKMAFATTYGFINSKSNPYTLCRLSTNDTNDFNEFILRVSGVWGFLKKIKLF
jgi:peptidoglycan/xylan/chitin deacetylase (PgdA/CDA1 family)